MKQKQILKVINNLKKVLPMATREDHLNMSQVGVKDDTHECGTTHCHGGWYAVAVCNLNEGFIDFGDGALKMAKTLGFKDENELERYMSLHPEIWGNNNGYYMFYDESAFFHETKRRDGAKTLQDIIDHWEEVYQRVKNPEYEEA